MIDFSKIKTYPIKERQNKISVSDISPGVGPNPTLEGFWNSLPNLLKAADFKSIVGAMAQARTRQRALVWMMGAHVIKCGLSGFIIQLMEQGYLTSLALNGAGSIHDFELASFGGTSEDVAASLQDGSFGMADETGAMMNAALRAGNNDGLGWGAAIGRALEQAKAPHREHSLLYNAYKLGIPLTVHVAVGTDIIHQHPSCDGAVLGATSYRDFQLFANNLTELGDGGVVLNVGSAVILPEVFLKALTIVRNLDFPVRNFTSVNLDMMMHYRPSTNVVARPVQDGGQGFAIVGHHELTIPLLAWSLLHQLGEPG